MLSILRPLRAWSGKSLTITLLLVGVCALPSWAAHHEKEKTTAADVKEEAMETYQALKSYTLEQRDQAMAEANERLNKLDAQIETLQTRIDEGWQDMTQMARQETRQTLNALKQQRQEAAEWLGGMRHSSAAAWEEVKKGFADSYDRLEEAFRAAKRDFEDSEKN